MKSSIRQVTPFIIQFNAEVWCWKSYDFIWLKKSPHQFKKRLGRWSKFKHIGLKLMLSPFNPTFLSTNVLSFGIKSRLCQDEPDSTLGALVRSSVGLYVQYIQSILQSARASVSKQKPLLCAGTPLHSKVTLWFPSLYSASPCCRHLWDVQTGSTQGSAFCSQRQPSL